MYKSLKKKIFPREVRLTQSFLPQAPSAAKPPLKIWWVMEILFTWASPPMTRWWTQASMPPGRRWTLQMVRQQTRQDSEEKAKSVRLTVTLSLCPLILACPVTAPCGGSFSTNQGEIISPNWPNDYESLSVCTWRITIPSSKSIHVVFTHFELQAVNMLGNCVDYVEIFNGDTMVSLGGSLHLNFSLHLLWNQHQLWWNNSRCCLFCRSILWLCPSTGHHRPQQHSRHTFP